MTTIAHNHLTRQNSPQYRRPNERERLQQLGDVLHDDERRHISLK